MPDLEQYPGNLRMWKKTSFFWLEKCYADNFVSQRQEMRNSLLQGNQKWKKHGYLYIVGYLKLSYISKNLPWFDFKD